MGRVHLTDPSADVLTAIDTQWPPARRPTDWHLAWRWKALTRGKLESFVVVNARDKALGIWCSAKQKPILLPGGRFYRPDFLELAPDARGQGLGVFLFLLIAARALEIGATGVVLGTWEVLRRFYRGLGGVEGRPQGWNVEPNLVPFTFDFETLEGLRYALERMEDHGQTTTNI